MESMTSLGALPPGTAVHVRHDADHNRRQIRLVHPYAHATGPHKADILDGNKAHDLRAVSINVFLATQA